MKIQRAINTLEEIHSLREQRLRDDLNNYGTEPDFSDQFINIGYKKAIEDLKELIGE